MSIRKRKILGKTSGDEDPLSGMANLTDAMLVLAVGFLIFAVMSMNMQSVIFNDSSPEERSKLAEAIKNTVAVETGEEYNGTADVDSGSDAGMENMGTVYKDPDTGKLIMIPPTSS
ncbi:hypothetical protein MBCUT_16390 [Methanobrevibacter cuticularis]|uniref:DUF2149 domain-containing protein n=1 Tax=Methanobrevibacter cuticularis TaxID=47311 RepID=A0A166D463_9EURY|nr:DUF2149 domain-containing protein [Methanobrevibacter cuticularis]KZX15185.1 hypothetical protein MBCUT_16390 [Methanobrevibacter cuticularis]